MLTRPQLQTLQIARRKVEKASRGVFDESQWRLTLRNVGGVAPDDRGHISSKALSNAGFEAVMSFLAERGADDRGSDHWQRRDGQRRGYCTNRQAWLIRMLQPLSPYEMHVLCLRHSNGEHQRPEQLTVTQARRVIEWLKKYEPAGFNDQQTKEEDLTEDRLDPATTRSAGCESDDRQNATVV